MSRYYETSEEEIVPGRLSAELREALNIAESDVPIWIYRMRALGYPPGWLKKAIVDTTDIFDLSSSSSNSTNSNKRKTMSYDEQVQYDYSKLIEYPGFNSPMPPNSVDQHQYVHMPAMLEHQQLEYAKKYMNAFKPATIPKRPKVETSNSLDSEQATASDKSKTSEVGSSNELDNSKTTATEEATTDNLTNSSMEQIKLVHKGSPMPKPVQRAPLEKFSEGVVGELLYFENIPSSTGQFDSIKGVLNSIRQSTSDADR